MKEHEPRDDVGFRAKHGAKGTGQAKTKKRTHPPWWRNERPQFLMCFELWEQPSASSSTRRLRQRCLVPDGRLAVPSESFFFLLPWTMRVQSQIFWGQHTRNNKQTGCRYITTIIINILSVPYQLLNPEKESKRWRTCRGRQWFLCCRNFVGSAAWVVVVVLRTDRENDDEERGRCERRSDWPERHRVKKKADGALACDDE